MVKSILFTFKELSDKIYFPVFGALSYHLFPYRTESLKAAAGMIVIGQLIMKIPQGRIFVDLKEYNLSMKEFGAKPISFQEKAFYVTSKISFGAAGLMAVAEIANKAIELIKTHKVTGSEADLILGLGAAAMYGIGVGFREKLPIRSN